jgi:plastocyanin
MSKIAAVAGLAVLMAACGDKSGDTPAADTTTVAAAPAPAPAGATHDVNMVMEGTAYKFVPADLSVRVGDQVVFHNVSGGPHNVAFWADSIPAGLKDQIAPLSSALVVDPNATITISFANAPTGDYRFTCTPHLAMGMHGKITVTP